MALFWPIFIALIAFGIVCYFFGSTRRSPVAKSALYAASGVFFMLTAAIIQSNGLMIDWPTTMNQGTIDGNTMTTITYTTLTSAEGNEIWMLSMGMMAVGFVVIISALITLRELFGMSRDEAEEF